MLLFFYFCFFVYELFLLIYFFAYRKIRKVLTGVLALVQARILALILVYLGLLGHQLSRRIQFLRFVNHCDKCFLKMRCIIATLKTRIRLMGKMNAVFYLSSICEILLLLLLMIIIIIIEVIVLFL